MSTPGGCTVWWAVPGPSPDPYLRRLDGVERDRVAALRRPADQARSGAAAALLRQVVAELCGGAPEHVHVDRACEQCGGQHGRPRLPGLDLHVSVSHSGDRVAVAVTADGPVGVDVERVRSLDLDAVGRVVLGPGEVAGHPADFAVYWTRKESVVKATGEGLRVPLSQVLVTAPDEPPALRSYRGAPLAASMSGLNPGAGYLGAVTVLSPAGVVVTEKWADLAGAGAALGG